MSPENLLQQKAEVKVEPAELTYWGEPCSWEDGVLKGTYPGVMVKLTLGEEIIWKKGIYSHRMSFLGPVKEKRFDKKLEKAVEKATKKAAKLNTVFESSRQCAAA